MSEQQPGELPEGLDEEGYQRLRDRMRISVLGVWKGHRQVMASVDPWDVVDEAWSSMVASNFKRKGPFLPYALRVAKNKAVDALRRAETKARGPSLDEPIGGGDDDKSTGRDLLRGSSGADDDYFRDREHARAVLKLSLIEDAVYEEGVLTETERKVFVGRHFHDKSGAAIGRELDPRISGQAVGQILAKALVKINRYLKDRQALLDEVLEVDEPEGGEQDERE